MRASKYIAIAIVTVALLLATGWFLRNALIQRLSNPLLDEYDLSITDVSLDALATRDARISYLELAHVDGARISIDDLTLPIRRSATGLRSLSAASVTIELPPGDDNELLDLAGILIQLLELPLQLRQTEIVIGEFSAPPYPVIRELRWRFMGEEQDLTAALDTLSIRADISQKSDTYYLVNLSFRDAAAGTAEQSITADLRRTDTTVAMEGSGTFDLRLWSPVIALLGIDAVSVESGLATLRFDAEIDYDANQIPFVNAGFTPTTPVRLGIAGIADAIRSITIQTASTTEISVALTDLQWTIRQPQASVTVSDGYGNDFAVSFSDVSCQSGPACSGDVSMVAERLDLPFANIAGLELAATHELQVVDNAVRMRMLPDATIALSGVDSPDLALARVEAKLTSAAEFDLADTGWQFTSQSVDVAIDEYSVTDGLTVSVTAFLDDVSAVDKNQQPFLHAGVYASSSRANWNTRRIQLPGFRGDVTRRGAAVAVDIETSGLAEEAEIEVRHDLSHDSGQVSVRHAGLSFKSQPLSKRISPRPRGWDVIAGSVGADLEATWRRDAAEWKIDATSSLRVAELAGNWQDTVFAGLKTGLEARFDSTAGFSVQPSTIELALLEVGVPVENLSADYTLHPGELSADVTNLRMTAFGGVITADPFSFSTARERNNLTLHAASIDLAEILSIEEFEAIEISGKIGAELPVTIVGKNVTVNGGTLTGEAPGGVIRYRQRTGSDEPATSSIDFVTRALSNFQYDTLTSSVEYDSDGNLKLQMRLTGRNPDLESQRPVILNLGVENNVPQMLRSLQAARAVEEILERRLGQ